jgi:bifunctional non-homologous end joining protein LigD
MPPDCCSIQTAASGSVSSRRPTGTNAGRKGDDLVYAGNVPERIVLCQFESRLLRGVIWWRFSVKKPSRSASGRLEPLVRKTQAFAKRIAHKGIWVEPKLLAEIEYRAKSAEGKVRHPFFKGLREEM